MTTVALMLNCPTSDCGKPVTDISYRVDFCILQGVRTRRGGTWVLPCGHEIPDILDRQFDSDKGVTEVRDVDGTPLLRWRESAQ